MKEGKILQTIPKSAWPDPAEIQVWHVLQHSLKYHTRQNWCGGRETARSPSLFNPFSTHTPEGFHLLSPKNLLYRESYFPPQNPQNWLCRLQLRVVDILSPLVSFYLQREIFPEVFEFQFAYQLLRVRPWEELDTTLGKSHLCDTVTVGSGSLALCLLSTEGKSMPP